MSDQVNGVTAPLSAAGTEGGRRPTGVPAAEVSKISPPSPLPELSSSTPHPNPQVLELSGRPRFSKEYRTKILREIDASTQDGDVGRILRREGLYSSLVSSWRRKEKREQQPQVKVPVKPAKSPDQDANMAQLRRENTRLKAKLLQAELILEIQKKASEILGISLKTLDNERND
jgi:transposase